MPEDMLVRFNLPADSPIESISGLIGDLSLVCNHLADLQRRDLWSTINARSQAFNQQIDPDAQRSMAEILASNDDEFEVRVRSIGYGSPLDLYLVIPAAIYAGGSVVRDFLKLIRDWPYEARLRSADARIRESQARMAEAAADDYDDIVATKKALRRYGLRKVEAGESTIRIQDLLEIVEDDTFAKSAARLSSAEMELPEAATA